MPKDSKLYTGHSSKSLPNKVFCFFFFSDNDVINDANVKAVVVEQVLALTQVFSFFYILQRKNVVDLPIGPIYDPYGKQMFLLYIYALDSRATLLKGFF